MTKMAASSIYSENLKKSLLQNKKFFDLETWHASLETQRHTIV